MKGDGQSDDPQRTVAGNPLIVEPLQSKRLERLHANGHFVSITNLLAF